ncbi:MAG: tetratricopeptide repeat protein [Acidobacteria bacterium]|nr:tetratricopeptide repeat protein [Acidobacteriota bacterium]
MKSRIMNPQSQLKARKGMLFRFVVLLLGVSAFSAEPLFAQIHLADPGYVHNHKANQLFDAGEYQAALQEYIQALSLRDDSPQVKYNMGNAFVKSGRVKDAIKTYKDLLSKAPDDLQPRLFYNTGNALYNAKKYKEAAGFYRKTLLADPGDRWAKENYEMSLKKIQEQKQQQKQQDDKKDKKKDDKKQQDQKQNKPDQQKKQSQKPPQSVQQQRKERAKRILKGLREQEKQDRKRNAKQKAVRPVERNVKDW